MAKYDTTKFYWLQLKEDFFEDDAINWLEEQDPNGRDYAYFYLKLCLKSLKSNGILIRKVGNILIPYDNKKLAELTKMDFDTVCIAMELLKRIGLVQILENGEIYMNQLEKLIGSQSVGAFKKQQQRLLKIEDSGHLGDICPPKIEIEKEIEIDNRNININNNMSKVDDNFSQEFELIWSKYPNKKGKDNAKKDFIKARKEGIPYDVIDKGLDNYIAYVKFNKLEQKYILHGSTWMHQRRWNDEYTGKDVSISSIISASPEYQDMLKKGLID